MKNEHGDVILEGKLIDTFFEVNILKAYQKGLTRLAFIDVCGLPDQFKN